MFGWSWKEVLFIAVVAFIGVWLIDKGLSKVGAGNYAINSPN